MIVFDIVNDLQLQAMANFAETKLANLDTEHDASRNQFYYECF